MKINRLRIIFLFVCVCFASEGVANIIYTYSGGQGSCLKCINGMSFQFAAPTLLTLYKGIPPDTPQVPVSSFTHFTYPTSDFLGITLFTVFGTADGIAFEEPDTRHFVYFREGSLLGFGTFRESLSGKEHWSSNPSQNPLASSYWEPVAWYCWM